MFSCVNNVIESANVIKGSNFRFTFELIYEANEKSEIGTRLMQLRLMMALCWCGHDLPRPHNHLAY